MNISEIYNVFGIISIIFNIGLTLTTYRNKKSTETISNKIKETIESDKKDRRDIELFANLLTKLNSIESSLILLRKTDEELLDQGSSVLKVVQDIQDKFIEIQNNEYVFKNNNHEAYLTEFGNLLETYDESKIAQRRFSLKRLREINSLNTSFLRKLKSDLQ